jgi:hypothetical protein
MKFPLVFIAALVVALPRYAAHDYDDLDYEENKVWERPSFYQAANHNLNDDQLTPRRARIRRHDEHTEAFSHSLLSYTTTQHSCQRPVRKELAIVLVYTKDVFKARLILCELLCELQLLNQ